VPGERIGEVRVGMAYAEVIKALGTPFHEEDLGKAQRTGFVRAHDTPPDTSLPKLTGILQDDWITPLPVSLNPDSEDPIFMCNFVTVYTDMHDGKVVQIEIRAPRFKIAEGCSSSSTALDLRKHYSHYQTTSCRYVHPSSGGLPAAKHFIILEDAVAAGIAWRYGAMGDLSPDLDSGVPLETVIVHAPGKTALLDPDGGSRFIWKVAPAHLGEKQS
jgi:hypothetical protein